MEGRVAQMVAQGMINREIAAALFITESTVKQHVRSIFRKYGLTSRKQIKGLYYEASLCDAAR